LKNSLDSLLNNFPFPAVVVESTNEIVEFNDHFLALTGHTSRSLRCHPVLEFNTRCDEFGKDKSINRSAIPGQDPLYKTEKINGEPLYLKISEFPIDEVVGSPRMIIFHDETEKIALRDENQHMSRLASVGELVSFVVHDIGNFISVIKGCSDLLLSREYEDQSTREEIERIQREAGRVSDIIKNFLGFSRKDDNSIESIQVLELLQYALELKTHSLKRKRIASRIEHDEDDYVIKGNRTLLMQVLLNLIDNAEEAVSGCEKSRITLRLAREDGNITIVLSDTGTGIPDKSRDKIFEAFFTTKKNGSGTGLGLSICKRIIRNHGGDFLLQSTSPGEGSVFKITLPAADHDR
jgi:signal transduction histidine kinase